MDGSSPQARSVKIGADERTGWSSDRPRRDGQASAPRVRDISVRTRVLKPAFRLRYSPGSLVLIVSATPARAEAFAQRVLEEPNALFSRGKVEALLRGKVDADELDSRVTQLLDAAILRRIQAGESTVVILGEVDASARAALVRAAAELRRPRHLILLEAPRDEIAEDDRAALNELRTAVDTGTVGQEGIQTALRLGGAAITETKKLVFRPPPSDD